MDWRHQLAQDVDVVCWWYACSREEKAQIIETARASPQAARDAFTAMAAEVHRAIIFG